MRPVSRTLMTIGRSRASLDGQTITYTLKVSRRARQARLEFRDDAGLAIILPRWMGRKAAAELLGRHRRWVLARLAESARRRTAAKCTALFFLGEECALSVIESADRRGVALDDHRLTVTAPPGEAPAALVEQWYRGEARRRIEPRLARFAPELGVVYRRALIGYGRTRWASCSPKASLSFNWKLIMAPPAVIDYVVIHELAHIRQMDHSARFWRLVEAHCPEWRAHRRWLRDHQWLLDSPLPLPS